MADSEKKVTDSFLTQEAKDIYNELLGNEGGGGGALPDVTSSDYGKVLKVTGANTWGVDKCEDSRIFIVKGTYNYNDNTITGDTDGISINMCIWYGMVGILSVEKMGAGLIYVGSGGNKAMIPSINPSKAFVIPSSSQYNKTWTLES